MPLEKLPPREPFHGWSIEKKGRCFNPEHNPPNMIRLDPGDYCWTCPGCGVKQYFTVPEVTF